MKRDKKRKSTCLPLKILQTIFDVLFVFPLIALSAVLNTFCLVFHVVWGVFEIFILHPLCHFFVLIGIGGCEVLAYFMNRNFHTKWALLPLITGIVIYVLRLLGTIASEYYQEFCTRVEEYFDQNLYQLTCDCVELTFLYRSPEATERRIRRLERQCEKLKKERQRAHEEYVRHFGEQQTYKEQQHAYNQQANNQQQQTNSQQRFHQDVPPVQPAAKKNPFSNVNTLEELRGIYKGLCKQFHPDVAGGSNEAMQLFNQWYAERKRELTQG